MFPSEILPPPGELKEPPKYLFLEGTRSPGGNSKNSCFAAEKMNGGASFTGGGNLKQLTVIVVLVNALYRPTIKCSESVGRLFVPRGKETRLTVCFAWAVHIGSTKRVNFSPSHATSESSLNAHRVCCYLGRQIWRGPRPTLLPVDESFVGSAKT